MSSLNVSSLPPAPPHQHWRQWLRRSGVALAINALCVLLALIWLLGSRSGRDLLLDQLAAHLPEGSALTIGQAEGVLLGHLTLHEVTYVQTAPELTMSARRVRLGLALWPLIIGRVQFNTLDMEDALLDLPPAEPSAFAWPRWPEVLPDIGLPLTIKANALAVNRWRIQRTGTVLVDIQQLSGGLTLGAAGVRAEMLVMDSDRGSLRVDGDYAPHRRNQIDMTMSAQFPATPGQPRPYLDLLARGTVDALELALSGAMPAPIQAQWSLRGEHNPQWTLHARADAFDPGLLAGTPSGTPIRFNLNATGADNQSHWQGQLQRDDLAIVLHPSILRTSGQRLESPSAQVELTRPGVTGQFQVNGHVDFGQPDSTPFALNVATDTLTLTGRTRAVPPVNLRARLDMDGQLNDWTATGTVTLIRAGQQARVRLSAHGNQEQMRLHSLHADMPGGQLQSSGQLTWQPALGWDVTAVLAGFDPGYFVPDWPGVINADIRSQARTDAAGSLQIEVNTDTLNGYWRQRALDGAFAFSMDTPASDTPSRGQGEVRLRLGQSRIEAKGDWGEQLDIKARLSPLHLADVLPEGEGEMQGHVQLSGTWAAPVMTAEFSGHHLRYADMQVSAVELHGTLPWHAGDERDTLVLDLSNINTNAVSLERLHIEASGAAQALALTLETSGEPGTLSARTSLQQQGQQWNGRLSALQLTPTGDLPWTLQAPVDYAGTTLGWSMQRGCLTTTEDGLLCAEIDWPRQLNVEARTVPLSLLAPVTAPWLPEPAPGHPWRLRGTLDLTAELRPSGAVWQGHLQLRSGDGGVRASERARRDVISYRDLVLDLTLTQEQIRAQLEAGLDADGHTRLTLTTGWEATSPLDGRLELEMRDLTWLELLSQDIAASKGQLTGEIGLGGTRAQPHLRGQARLCDFSTELPALAIVLEAGEVSLSAEPDGSARIVGSMRSGEGRLNLDGSLNWRGEDVPLLLHLRGDKVLASDTRDLRLIINPDLTVRHAGGQPLSVSGRVDVPAALLDLERLDSGVSTSADVVVLDPVSPARAGGQTPLRLDLNLTMGEDVRLRGFGLDGKLDGNLHVRAEPGREMVGTGQLEVSGGYKAYGQALRITRGSLVFSTVPIADPVLQLSAERSIEADGITAGITVTGRASAPDVAVWSTPASDNTQALAYLAFGRSLSSLSSSQGQQLDAASAALTAGGNLLAGQIGHRIGLDDAGITTSRALGGNVFGIGKQISPRLYIGFGVSLIGTGQVLTLKYLLRKGFDLELESSTLESRGSINWRHESD